MPVNATHCYRVFGLRRGDNALVAGSKVIKGAGNEVARGKFMEATDTYASCLVDCGFTSQIEALMSMARAKLAKMCERMGKPINFAN